MSTCLLLVSMGGKAGVANTMLMPYLEVILIVEGSVHNLEKQTGEWSSL